MVLLNAANDLPEAKVKASDIIPLLSTHKSQAY